MSHTQEMELLPAPAVIGEAVILSSTFPEAAIRSCTFRQEGSWCSRAAVDLFKLCIQGQN